MSTFKDNTWICKDNFWISSAENPAMTEELRKRHTAKLDETRQLTGHYTCGLEPSGEYVAFGEWDCSTPFKFEHDIDWCVVTRRGVDLDQFKRECEEIDRG